MSRTYGDFLPHTCTASSIISIPQMVYLLQSDEPTLMHHNVPKSIVNLWVHSWVYTFYVVDVVVVVAKLCLALFDPMGCSPPGSPVHGILQARILEWIAISFSRGSSQPGIKHESPSLQADFLASELPGKLKTYVHTKTQLPHIDE